MSIGKNLSALRRKNGLTQQQLADMLNISAQAVSKWENELAEPDLGTVKKIASIYKVSVDAILETDMETAVDASDAETIAASVSESLGEKMAPPIGFCKECGITVTKENLGTDRPVVMCKTCLDTRERAEKAEKDKKRGEIRKEIGEMRTLRKWSIAVGIILGIAEMVITLVNGISKGNTGVAVTGALAGLFTYTFVSLCFFEDSKVRAILEFMCGVSIKWPGLIFELDFDGVMWFIAMKVIFAVLGFLAGILFAILGIIVAFLFSLLEYPFFMVSYQSEINDLRNDLKRV